MWYLAHGDTIFRVQQETVRSEAQYIDDWLERNLALIAFGMCRKNWGQYDFNQDLWRLDTETYRVNLRDDATSDNMLIRVTLRK